MVLASRAILLFTGVAQSWWTADEAPKDRNIRSCNSFSSGIYQLPLMAACTQEAFMPSPMDAAAPRLETNATCLMKLRRVDMCLSLNSCRCIVLKDNNCGHGLRPLSKPTIWMVDLPSLSGGCLELGPSTHARTHIGLGNVLTRDQSCISGLIKVDIRVVTHH